MLDSLRVIRIFGRRSAYLDLNTVKYSKLTVFFDEIAPNFDYNFPNFPFCCWYLNSSLEEFEREQAFAVAEPDVSLCLLLSSHFMLSLSM